MSPRKDNSPVRLGFSNVAGRINLEGPRLRPRRLQLKTYGNVCDHLVVTRRPRVTRDPDVVPEG